MAESDWVWTVQLEAPSRYGDLLSFEVMGSASGEIADPLTIARLIAKHVSREMIERVFETEDLTSA